MCLALWRWSTTTGTVKERDRHCTASWNDRIYRRTKAEDISTRWWTGYLVPRRSLRNTVWPQSNCRRAGDKRNSFAMSWQRENRFRECFVNRQSGGDWLIRANGTKWRFINDKIINGDWRWVWRNRNLWNSVQSRHWMLWRMWMKSSWYPFWCLTVRLRFVMLAPFLVFNIFFLEFADSSNFKIIWRA